MTPVVPPMTNFYLDEELDDEPDDDEDDENGDDEDADQDDPEEPETWQVCVG